MNKKVVVTKNGGPEVLQIVRAPIPEPGADEARVKVIAADVAFADTLARRGMYPNAPKMPFAPGYDMVGIVEKAGATVSLVKEGQRVVALLKGFGGYAQYLCVPEKMLIPVPANVDSLEAVAVPLNFLTAHSALHQVAQAKTGERLLVTSAAGGVGTAALQLGRIAGLEMYGTASTHKLELVRKLGATAIDYRKENLAQRLRALTNGEGIDVALDAVGGDALKQAYGLLRKGGRLVAYGFLGAMQGNMLGMLAGIGPLFFYQLLPDGKRAQFYGDLPTRVEKDNTWYRATMTQLIAWLSEGKIKPVIGKQLPLEQAAEAHRLLETGAVFGKIVLTCE